MLMILLLTIFNRGPRADATGKLCTKLEFL